MRFKRTKENEERIIEAYKRLGTYKAVAAEIGCSWNTVQRVMVKTGANPGQGNHVAGYHGGTPGYHGGTPRKITDEELKAAVERHETAMQIAKNHGMSTERVYRRIKKLGLQHKTDWCKWKQRAERYGCKEYDESITLDAVYDRYKGICQICGRPTDKNAKSELIRR